MQLGTQKEKRVFSFTWILDLKECRCLCKKCKDVNSACCLWVLCDAQVLSVSRLSNGWCSDLTRVWRGSLQMDKDGSMPRKELEKKQIHSHSWGWFGNSFGANVHQSFLSALLSWTRGIYWFVDALSYVLKLQEFWWVFWYIPRMTLNRDYKIHIDCPALK